MQYRSGMMLRNYSKIKGEAIRFLQRQCRGWSWVRAGQWEGQPWLEVERKRTNNTIEILIGIVATCKELENRRREKLT